MSNIAEIDFFGDSIIAIEKDGEIFISVSKICQNIGIKSPKDQYIKIKDNPLYEKGWGNFPLPSNRGIQTTFCILLKFLPIWLSSINTKNLESDYASEKILKYQREAADILYNYFHSKQNNNQLESYYTDLNNKIDLIYNNAVEAFGINNSAIHALEIKIAKMEGYREAMDKNYQALLTVINNVRGALTNNADELKKAVVPATVTSAVYKSYKELKEDPRLKSDISIYIQKRGDMPLIQAILNWMDSRGSAVKKGNKKQNLYPYQIVLDYFNPIHNKDITKIVPFPTSPNLSNN
jgi:hypothetical protein